MKPFREKSFLAKFFFIELVLICSLVLSLAVSVYMKATAPIPHYHLRSYKNLFANYRILRYFLYLPESVFTPVEEPTELFSHPLSAYIMTLKEVESLFKEKKYLQANRLLSESVLPHEFLKKKKNKLHLQILYFLQQYRQFLELYDAYPITDNLQIQLLRLNCLVKTNAEDKAFSLFKEMFLKNSLKPFKDTVSRITLNRFLQKLEYDDWFKKFSYLAQRNYYSEFLREKDYIKAPQLHHLFYAEFYYKQKKYTAVQQRLATVNSPKLLNHKKKLLLKIAIRRKEYQDLYKKLDELKNDDVLYAEVLFDAGGILLVHGELDLASTLFSRYTTFIERNRRTMKKDSDYWKALWLSAWIHYRKKEYDAAVRYFEKGTQSDNDSYRAANLYWLNHMRDTEPIQLEKYPFSYYYTKTRDIDDSFHQESLQDFISLIDGKQGPLFLSMIYDLKALLANGLIEESFDFIAWARQEHGLSRPEKNILKLIESIIYYRKGDFYHAFVSFRKNFECYSCLRLPKFLGKIYSPIKYADLVESHSTEQQLDSNLVFALIREESFFRPNIISPARANGLMQLLYGTAREIAARQGKKISRWDLYNPLVNIQLGTQYLRRLLDKYDGKLHLALAAYNAGDHRVDAWLDSFGEVPEDEFIELIPFTETRTYVKNILRNYYYYRFYYGDKKNAH